MGRKYERRQHERNEGGVREEGTSAQEEGAQV